MIKKTVQKPRFEEVTTQVGTYDLEVFETSDGREFANEYQAKRHEWELIVNKKVLSFPYDAKIFYFNCEEDLVEFEKGVLSYRIKKKYDENTFTYPNIFATYKEESLDEEDDYYTDVFVVPYEIFKRKIIEELESALK